MQNFCMFCDDVVGERDFSVREHHLTNSRVWICRKKCLMVVNEILREGDHGTSAHYTDKTSMRFTKYDLKDSDFIIHRNMVRLKTEIYAFME